MEDENEFIKTKKYILLINLFYFSFIYLIIFNKNIKIKNIYIIF